MVPCPHIGSTPDSRRSAIVAPGIAPTPPGITRVGMPSVWESTALKYLVAPISGSAASSSLSGPRGVLEHQPVTLATSSPSSFASTSAKVKGFQAPVLEPGRAIITTVTATHSRLKAPAAIAIRAVEPVAIADCASIPASAAR
jgi:hypothetical protein